METGNGEEFESQTCDIHAEVLFAVSALPEAALVGVVALTTSPVVTGGKLWQPAKQD